MRTWVALSQQVGDVDSYCHLDAFQSIQGQQAKFLIEYV